MFLFRTIKDLHANRKELQTEMSMAQIELENKTRECSTLAQMNTQIEKMHKEKVLCRMLNIENC